jgi:hypothetical protein
MEDTFFSPLTLVIMNFSDLNIMSLLAELEVNARVRLNHDQVNHIKSSIFLLCAEVQNVKEDAAGLTSLSAQNLQALSG